MAKCSPHVCLSLDQRTLPISVSGKTIGELSDEATDPHAMVDEKDEKCSFEAQWFSHDEARPVVPPMGTNPSQDPEAVEHLVEEVSRLCLASDEAIGLFQKGDEEQLGEFLSSCKEEATQTLSSEFDSCTDAQKVVCAYDNVYRVYRYPFTVTTTNPIVIKTYNLQPHNGSRPDTLIYLVYLPSPYWSYKQVAGDVVAINDDGNTETPCDPSYPGYPYSCWDSKIVYTPTRTGHYLVVMTSYYQGKHGFADISISYDGALREVHTTQFFGGYHIRGKEVRSNDILLVGKNSNGAGMPEEPEYHDSILFYFTTMSLNCTTGSCGKMLVDDDLLIGSRLYLSRLDIPLGYASTNARIVIGVYRGICQSGNPCQMNARFMHIRRHTQRGGNWNGAAQMDIDGDGLTKEIEAILGSCDSATDTSQHGVGVMFMDCQAFGTLVNQRVNANRNTNICSVPPSNNDQDPDCWSPKDSDNDGLQDVWEVWAVGVKSPTVPTSPYYGCDSCEPISLLEARDCPAGHYCTVLALSALSDPDPTRYDLYYLTDYWACQTCDPQHSHEVTPEQQIKLTYTWVYDPLTCFDGSLYWPNDPCPHPNDLPYKVAMHLYNGKKFSLPDDSAGDYSLPFGVDGTASYFNHSLPSDKKHTRVFRYALATHHWGGQARKSIRRLVWGNTDADAILQVFSHEAGHTLSLEDVIKGDAALSGRCLEEYEREAGWQCNNPNFARRARGQNPNYPSLMSYPYARQRGMRPKGAPPPGLNTPPFAGCSREYLRFSKGLNPILSEQFLNEVYNQNDWWVPKFINDLFCFKDENWRVINTNPYRPHCTGGICFVNWDALRTGCAQPNPPYAFDVSYGRYCAHFSGDYRCCPPGQNCQGLAQCARDELIDYNDWLAIVALGKRSLRGTWVKDFAIYQDSYNGAAFGNYAGWTNLEVSGQVQFMNDKYPHNVCTTNGQCPSGLCLFRDLCSSNADCLRGQECRNGVCTCSFHTDCYGARCLPPSGICDVSYGVCSCQAHLDCPYRGGGVNCHLPEQRCNSWYDAKFSLGEPKASAVFTGPGSGTYIKVQDIYSSGPLSSIGDNLHDSFQIRLDFKPGPLSPTQTQATLIRSNAFRAEIVRCTGGYCLRLYAANEPVLEFPSANTGAPLQSWRWYRMVWSAKRGGSHFVAIQPWDYLRGGYWDDISGAGCVYRSFSSDLPAPGAVWIGWDGASGVSRYYGLVDNFNLWNFVRLEMPQGCVQVSP